MSTNTTVENTPSLLDLVTKKYEEAKSKKVTRILLTATLTNPSSETLIEQYFHSFNDKQPLVQDDAELFERPDALTGACMIVNHTALILLLEGPEAILRDVIQDATIIGGEDIPYTSSSSTASSSSLSSEEEHQPHVAAKLGSPPPNATGVMKICSYSEDVPREFNTLAFRQARATVEDLTALPNPAKTIWDIYRHLLELGREACAVGPPPKAKDYIARSNARQLLQHIPTAEKLGLLCACDDVPSAMEWIGIFEGPCDDVMDEEAWPADDFDA